MVSGSHFLPKAPLLWVKRIPACVVMSRKWIWAWAGRTRQIAINHRDTETTRKSAKKLSPSPCEGGLHLFFRMNIYREAPAEGTAGLCPAGRTRAAVPAFVLVTGNGT